MITHASEAVLAKAARLLTSGRVCVTEADDTTGIFVAAVVGDTGSYVVYRDQAGGPWSCSCPAGARFGRACAHRAAVALVAG